MKLKPRILIGGIVVAVGILLLFQSFNLLEGGAGSIIAAGIWGALGLTALYYFYKSKQFWWGILGFMLVVMMISNLLDIFNMPAVTRDLITLCGFGCGFIGVYIANKKNWWGVIVSGMMFSVAATIWTQAYAENIPVNGIFFIGLGVTFILLYLLSIKDRQMNWALIPAAIFLLLGAGQSYGLADLLGPIIILLAGIVVLLVSFRKK